MALQPVDTLYTLCRVKESESVEENVHAKLQLMFTVITALCIDLEKNFETQHIRRNELYFIEV